MAADGRLNFDTSLNTEGFDKGAEELDRKAEKTAKEVTDTAESAAESVKKAAESAGDVKVSVSADTSAAVSAVDALDTDVPEVDVPVDVDDSAISEKSAGLAERIRAVFDGIGDTFRGISDKAAARFGVVEKSADSASDRIKRQFAKAGKSAERSMSSSCGQIGKNLDGVKSRLKDIAAAVGLAFSVRQVANFAKSAIETSAEVNAAQSALTQTFGEMEGAAVRSIEQVAESSGIVADRLKGAGTQIFAFAKASGMDAPQALDMMSDALQVAADSAAYYDRSLEETSETLRSFLKGNYANDAALGVSCTETTRNIAANKLYGKSFKDLSEAQKQLALLQMVKDANKLSGAEGQAAREAEGWENVIGNLKEVWRQLMAVVGQPMLHVATSAVKSLTVALSVLLEKARAAVSALSALFGWETDQTAAAAANIAESVANQDDLTTAVEETTKAEDGSLAGFDKLNTISSKTAESAEPETVATVGISPIVATDKTEKAAGELTDKVQKFLKPVQLAWDANSADLIAQAQQAVNGVKSLFSSIGGSFAEVWENGSGEALLSGVLVVFGDILGTIGDISTALKNAWDDGGRGTALVQSYFDQLTSVLALIHAVSDAFRTAWNDGTGERICANILEILTNINNVWTNLRTQFIKAWQENGRGAAIFSGILGIVESILTTVNRLTGATAKWAKNLDFAPLLDSVHTLLDALRPLTDNIGDGLVWLYENALLPLGKWTVEKAVPAFLKLLASAIKVVNSVIIVLRPLAEFLFQKFLKPLAQWTGGVIISVLDGISAALSGLADWIIKHQSLLENLLIVIGSVAAAIGVVSGAQALGALLAQLPVLLAQIVAQTAALIANAAAWIAANAPIIAVTAAIAAVIAIGVLLIKHWDEVKAFALGVWAEIQQNLWDFFDNVRAIFDGITAFFRAVWASVKLIFAGVGKWFSDKFEAAAKGIRTAFSFVQAWFGERFKEVTAAFSEIPDYFSRKFQSARDAVTGIFSGIGEWFLDRYNDVTSAFSAVGSWFSGKFAEAWDGVSQAFTDAGRFFTGIWSDIRDVFWNVGGWFWDKFHSAYDNVTGIWEDISGFFSGLWDSIGDGAVNGVNWLIDALNGFLEAIENGVNWIVQGLNFLSFDAPDWLEEDFGISSFGFDLPEIGLPRIPHLAQGTYVPANYGEFLTVLGDNKREAEVVSPVSGIEKAMENVLSRHNFGGNIEVVCVLDGKAIGRAAVKAVDENNRRKGG